MGTKTQNAPAPLTAGELTNRLLIEIPKRLNVRIWRNNRLNAWMKGADGKFHPYSAGIDGQADISGIGPGPNGRRLEIEVKVGRDSQNLAQRAFQQMIESRGGIYIIARDIDGCLEELGRRLK